MYVLLYFPNPLPFLETIYQYPQDALNFEIIICLHNYNFHFLFLMNCKIKNSLQNFCKNETIVKKQISSKITIDSNASITMLLPWQCFPLK